MAPYEPKKTDTSRWRPETQLVHGGVLRSGFGETSEAIFLTQGFVYNSAEQAEARFKNEDPGFQYSRFSNPTVSMFEERMRILEGAEEARATATGMAAVTAAILSCLSVGDHIVAARAADYGGDCRVDAFARMGLRAVCRHGSQCIAARQRARRNGAAVCGQGAAVVGANSAVGGDGQRTLCDGQRCFRAACEIIVRFSR